MRKIFNQKSRKKREIKTNTPGWANKEPCRELSSDRWKQLREIKLRQSPLCQTCKKVAAEEVHHIFLTSERKDLIFDQRNLWSVCESCHFKIHGAYRRGYTQEQLFKIKL